MWVPLLEGELYLSWMHFFPSPFLPFILILFILLSFIAFPFFCSRANQGTLPWRGDQWWQRYPQVLSQK
jgi:hypothetical protein